MTSGAIFTIGIFVTLVLVVFIVWMADFVLHLDRDIDD